MSGSTRWIGLGGFLLLALIVVSALVPGTTWEGVDVAVVERFAAQLGRAPGSPLLRLDGDLQLFVFTVAGLAGGFGLGYCWRDLFGKPPGK